jgi:hypothetical protein
MEWVTGGLNEHRTRASDHPSAYLICRPAHLPTCHFIAPGGKFIAYIPVEDYQCRGCYGF